MLLLQHAIPLGDVLKKCEPNVWLSADGSCGCALGGALLAAGVDAGEFFGQQGMGSFGTIAESKAVKERWSWLTYEHLFNISNLYHAVADRVATIEDVTAYVRSIEPVEPETLSPMTLEEYEEMQVAR